MRYASLEQCKSINPGITDAIYNSYAWEAGHIIDQYTSGVDGVRKLKIAYPTDEDNAEAVKRCFSSIINALAQIDDMNKVLKESEGNVVQDGRIIPKTVASMNSGSESISFVASGAQAHSAYYEAATNNAKRDELLYGIVKKYLSGARDDNGVSLLYAGKYPIIRGDQCTATV